MQVTGHLELGDTTCGSTAIAFHVRSLNLGETILAVVVELRRWEEEEPKKRWTLSRAAASRALRRGSKTGSNRCPSTADVCVAPPQDPI